MTDEEDDALLLNGSIYPGTGGFQPLLIVTRLLMALSAYWAALAFLVWLFWLPLSAPPATADLLFRPAKIDGQLARALHDLAVLLTSATVLAYSVSWAVERAKKTWDYVGSVHVLHQCVALCTSGFPAEWRCWLVVVSAAALGSWAAWHLCLQLEMREIVINKKRSNSPSSSSSGCTAVELPPINSSSSQPAARQARRGPWAAAAWLAHDKSPLLTRDVFLNYGRSSMRNASAFFAANAADRV